MNRQQAGRPAIDAATANSMAGISGLRLANAIADPVIVFSREFEIIFLNPPAITAFGENLEGRDIRVIFRAPEMHSLFTDVVRTGQTKSAGLSERVPLERFFQVTASLVDEKTGLYVLLFKDQTEARRIDRMRTDFVANASHELRTPLASITGFIETLRGPARDDHATHAQFLEIMHEQASRMSRLVADLLSLSRVEMKRDIRPDQSVDLREVMNTVIEGLSSLAADHGVKIEKLYDDREYPVTGDGDELVQVFQNMVENALNHGRSGKRVELGIERRSIGNVPVIDAWVRDYGPGIPREHIPRITERFYRVETGDKSKGTGLGLSIVKHILARHRATMSVDSGSGRGAQFTVTFAKLVE